MIISQFHINRRRRTNRVPASLIAITIVLGWAGVASCAEATNSDEQALRERATTYWTARVARDPSVLEFYPPEELRPEGTIVPERGPIRFTSFVIDSVEIDGDGAWLRVQVESEFDGRTRFPIPERVRNRTVSERWVKFDGLWFKQTVRTALNTVGAELKTAFERKQAEREAAAQAEVAANNKEVDHGAGSDRAGVSPPGNGAQ